MVCKRTARRTGRIPALTAPARWPGLAQRADAAQAPPRPPAGATIAYGADPLHRLDLWPAPGRNPAPLVLFVHGGGWKRGSKDSGAAYDVPAQLQAGARMMQKTYAQAFGPNPARQRGLSQ